MKSVPCFTDIHIHPTLKTFNSDHPKPSRNIWDDFEHIKPTTPAGRFAVNNSKDVAKFSQTNFYRLIEGNVRVVFASLYPMEKGFLRLRSVPKVITGKKGFDEMTAIASGYSASRVRFLMKSDNYFQELNEEYVFLKNSMGKSPCGKYEAKIVNTYADLKDITENKPNTIAVVMTIEGSHVFFNKEMLSGKLGKREMKDELKKNIIAVKEWEHPPFVMNLSHHFYNELCGHAKSFNVLIGEGLINQKKGLESGLTGLGIKAMKEMLSNSNGRRIYIDTKHMSMQGRREYYNWVRSYNYLNKNDNIPIICTHTGVNGFRTMVGSTMKKDSAAKNNTSAFFNWSINLSDEEIKIIHDTKGIMGIMLDKTKLGGGKFLREYRLLKTVEEEKDAIMKVFFENVFQAVKAIGKPDAWNTVSIGSDLDGGINTFDHYDAANRFPDLYDDLYSWLKRTQFQKSLWYGLKPEEILDRLFYKNTMLFCERYL